jgi:4-hydroxy-3-methylbut-2-enyl diphosphate reductase
VQPKTYLIGGPDEVQPQWLEEINSIGISGATSTPRWLMEEVKKRLYDSTTL